MSVQSSIDVQNPKQTINSCFKGMHYVVPSFQREYVWDDTQIEQLISDIEDAYNNNPNKEYFVGTTVVYKSDDKYQLVDGQQRMTTFFLMLCAMAKEYKKNEEPASSLEQTIYTSIMNDEGKNVNYYSLELQYASSTDCLSNIWEDKIPENCDNLPDASRRLYDAFAIIRKRLSADYPVFTDYCKFVGYFTNRVVFIQIGATNISDALKIFETINQRGVTLNPMDLLKNLLFMNIKEDQFKVLNQKWKGMIDSLEAIPEKPLRFLRYYLTATYDISDVKPDFQGIINEDDIYTWLSKNDAKCNYRADPMKFTDEMISGLDRYKGFLYPMDGSAGRDYLLNIKAMMGNSYRLHLVPLLASKNMDEPSRLRLFKIFDLVIYYAVVNNIKSNRIERLFSSWCPALRAITDEKGLNGFIDKKIIPTIDEWNMAYKQNFMNLSLAQIQKYKMKAILARITKYVDAQRTSAADETDISSYLKSTNEIEHIMPTTCDDYTAYGIKNVEDFNQYKDMLGNLTLLEKTHNASIQNDAYSSKIKVYKDSAFYLTKSISKLITIGDNTAANRMNDKLNSWSKWNKKSIGERQEMFYNLSKLVWDVTNLKAPEDEESDDQ